MEVGRPSTGITECVEKMITAKRREAINTQAAADKALEELAANGT
jgi:hypothetical protein